MDPNECLREMRTCYEQVLDPTYERLTDSGKDEIAVNLATHAEALDKWISSGGFLPTEWKP